MNGILIKLKYAAAFIRDIVSTGTDYLHIDTAENRMTAGHMLTLLEKARAEAVHPFILARESDFKRAAREYRSDSCNKIIKSSLDFVFSYCDELLDTAAKPPLAYVLKDDDGLLEVSRTVLQRVCALCGAFRISGKTEYAQRAVLELENVCRFPDWHSVHFLDCAEMAFAVSLGCDWLWDFLPPAKRELFGRKTWEYAVEPALSRNFMKNWWTWSKTNWNSVCYSSISAACMVFAEYEPEKAARMLAKAVNFMPAHFSSFTPDGVYAEGSGYWEYGTAYLMYYIQNTRAFFGTDFGLSKRAGFNKTGFFPLYITLPCGVFNYGDNKNIACASPVLYLFAREYGSSAPAEFMNGYTYEDLEDSARDSMLTALWYDPGLLRAERTDSLPLCVHLRSDYSQELVIMRSSYADKNAVGAAIKAGSNSVNHGDLDIGSFVLDCGGVRWVCELGQGNYAAPGYFMNTPGGGRWKNYCKRAEGQNTVVIVPRGKKAGEGQYALAKCGFSSFGELDGGGRAVLDMTPAYSFYGAESVVRAVELTDGFSHFAVRDEIKCTVPCDIYSFMHTAADIGISESGREAILSRDGKSIKVSLTENSGGKLVSRELTRLDGTAYKYDREFPGIRKLCIEAHNRLSVNFEAVFELI